MNGVILLALTENAREREKRLLILQGKKLKRRKITRKRVGHMINCLLTEFGRAGQEK